LLGASVDPEGGESDLRLLVDGSLVKYITIDGGLYDCEDMCFGPTLASLLPPLQSGDWNQARISRDPATGAPRFTAVLKAALPGITQTWHPLRIDFLELRMGRKLRTNLYEATCPRFTSTVIAKFARFPWEVPQLESETRAYEWIQGHDIGPAFLGHLLEEERVIGFIMARVSDFRHATVEDLPLCHSALARLHQLGIKHGDINKHNFLIHGGKATLIDFDMASRYASADELADELRRLPGQLRDMSGRGGAIIESASSASCPAPGPDLGTQQGGDDSAI
jgi:predicted Ser/Thr protein kinase